jgi:hypothetical protein
MVLAARIHAAEIESIGGFRCTTFLDTTGRAARRGPDCHESAVTSQSNRDKPAISL